MHAKNQAFQAKGLLANTHVQSMLASSKLRKRLLVNKTRALCEHEQALLLDCGNGIRLHALLSPQPVSAAGFEHADNASKLIIMIHGWEGSAESTYLLSTASALFNKGYSILRLHLRDHGPSANLNEGLFHAARLDEISGA